jgi:transposase
MVRGLVSDEDWAIIGPLLPAERGRSCRPSHDNRRFFDGMMHALRTGAAWRDLPEVFGNWNSIFRRFRRWCEQGVFDAILETLVELGITDDWKEQMVDSTSVRGHSQAAGAKGGPARKALVARAAVLRQKFMQERTARDARSPS